MRLFNCYHPSLVFNKYSKEFVVARCGKCPACLNARASSWVQRLDEEMQQHKYTFFVTLQYDEQHVQQYILLRDCDNPNTLPSYINSETGQIISLSDVLPVTPADIKYCYDTKVLLVHEVSDFQKFIKSLRKHIYKVYGKNANIRYYNTFEYGPTTYRPHSHSLFFFDSSLLAEDFARLLSLHWKYGCVFDPHSVSGSASRYVASYVNSFSRLPKIYLHPSIKQKSCFSKCPPLGSSSWSEKTFKELFNSGINQLTLFRKDVSQFRNVPLWRFVQSRLYPKFASFDRLNHFDRIALYQKGQLRSFRKRNVKAIIRHLTTFYWRPFFDVAFRNKNFLTRDECNIASLLRFVSQTILVCDNARKFGVSIDDYVTKIEEFYDSKQKSDFSEFYFLQNEYFKEHPLSDFLLLNPNFYICVKGKRYEELKDWQRFYLDLYMPNQFHDGDLINFSYSDAFAYRELRGLHDKIYFNNTKQKESNDWLLANRDKFNNIITYNQNIENYVKSETF